MNQNFHNPILFPLIKFGNKVKKKEKKEKEKGIEKYF